MAAKVRTERDGSRTLILIGSAASVLEGDELAVSLRVGPGARLTVRSVAAQLVHPCPGGGRGALTFDVEVGPGASLCWWPEPVVIAAGGRLRSRTTVACAADAGLWWADELVLGRSGEDRTDLGFDTSVRIDVDGRPVWRDGLSNAAGWTGPAAFGTARYVGSTLRLGPAGRPVPGGTAAPGPGAVPEPVGGESSGTGPVPVGPDPDPFDSGWLPLAAGGLLRRVLATDPTAGRARLGADGR